MNKFLTLTICCLVTICAQAQLKVIRAPQSITTETVVHRYKKVQKGTVREVYVKGEIAYSSPSGFVRILAKDKSGMEFLVYESFSLLASETGKDVFGPIAMETEGLLSYTMDNIRVVAKDATVSNLEVYSVEQGDDTSGGGLTTTRPALPLIHKLIGKTESRSDYIERLNRNIKASGGLWTAKETSLSEMTYEEKKRIYDNDVPVLNGYEYYGGGIFSFLPVSPQKTKEHSKYVKAFDWRTQHGATSVNSPYFQHEINGWITPVKFHKHCGACWAYVAVSLMEANTKLYKNTKYNFNLSGQELISCANGGTCDPSTYENALKYIKRNKLHNEEWFPYSGGGVSCKEDKSYLYGIGFQKENIVFDGAKRPSPERTEMLKAAIIKEPIGGQLHQIGKSVGHAMMMIGYNTLEEGDVVYTGIGTSTDQITISSTDPKTSKYLGQTVWLFKNSLGENWGDHGYLYLLEEGTYYLHFSAPQEFTFEYYPKNDPKLATPELERAILGDVEVHDYDGDGYYYWGIGPRPDHLLPADAQLEEDGNDNDHMAGPMDEFGRCKTLQEVDLYIKDNAEDQGIQPNLSIKDDNFWSSPAIWVRNKDDKYPEHQNAIGGKQNYVYASITNRGTKVSKAGKVSVYWTKAGTNL